MVRRQILVFARSDADSAAVRGLFAGRDEWEVLEPRAEAELLAAARRRDPEPALIVLDAAFAGTLAEKGLNQTGAPLVALLPREAALADLSMPDGPLVEYLETPIDPALGYGRLCRAMELTAYRQRDALYRRAAMPTLLERLPAGDSLAGAANEALAACKGKEALLLAIELDGMGATIERYGRALGDVMLQDAADTLSAALPKRALVGRPDGDTLCALIPGPVSRDKAAIYLEAIKKKFRRTYPLSTAAPVTVTVCMGVSRAPEDGDAYEELWNAAKLAMGFAGKLGKDSLVFYSTVMSRETQPAQDACPGPEPAGRPASAGTFAEPRAFRFQPIVSNGGGEVWGYCFYSALPEGGADGIGGEARRGSGVPGGDGMRRFGWELGRLFPLLEAFGNETAGQPGALLCAELSGAETEALPRMLEEALERHAVDPRRVCVAVPQRLLTDLDPGRPERVVRQVRALGFETGVYQAGERLFANACFDGQLFDRVVLAPGFAGALLAGAYPASLLDKVIPALLDEGIDVLFPMELSETGRGTAAHALGERFFSFAPPLASEDALRAHRAAHKEMACLPRTFTRTISFRIGPGQYTEIFEKSGVIVFDWRPYDSLITFSETFESVFGFPIASLRPNEKLLREIVHPEDCARFQDAMLKAKHGKDYSEGIVRTVRVTDGETSYRWQRYTLIALPDASGVVRRVLGIGLDIDRERRAMQGFKKLAETDSLTQLLNRGGTEARIATFLGGPGKTGEHALLLLDVDDFKFINDQFGHLAGDSALRLIAERLKTLFRSDDVIGRIGGDEFMVFLKNVDSPERVGVRANDIIVMMRGMNPHWGLSGTVGAARYPYDGETFQALYDKADRALYEAKKSGKNRWALWGGEGRG